MARTFTDPDDIILSANEPQAYATSGNSVQTDGTVGDIVFRTSGVERARIKADGTGTGWPNVLGGSLPVNVTGAKGDGQVVIDGAITSGAATLTSATGWFLPSDVGKTICITGAGAAGVRLVTTISAYVSATQVTLAATAGTTVSGARTIWATDDSAAINAAAVVAIAAGRPLYAPPPVTQFGTPGFYGVASTLTFAPASGTDPDTGATRSTFGIDVIFDGPGKSVRWIGADSGTVMSFKGFKRHKVYVSPCGEDASGVIVVDIDTSVADPSTSGVRLAGSIDLGGGANNVGLRLGHVSGGTADISSWNFEDLFIVGNYNNAVVTGQTAILDEGSNCLCLNWYGINVYTCDVGYTNKSSAGATSAQGGDAKNFFGGNFSGCNTDFQIANRGSYTMTAIRFENGKRTLDVTNASNDAEITIIDGEWKGYSPADGILFNISRPGSLVLINPRIPQTGASAAWTAAMITLAGFTGVGDVSILGGAICAAFPFWTANSQWRSPYLKRVGQLGTGGTVDRRVAWFPDSELALDELQRLDLGLIAWNYNPYVASTNLALTSETIYALKIDLRAGQVVSKVGFGIATAGAGTTPTNIFVGLADSTGKMVAQSADLKADAGWTTTGPQTFSLSAAYTVPTDGIYYVVVLQNGSWGTTQMALSRTNSLGNGKIGAIFVYATGGVLQSALPANGSSITLATTGTPANFAALAA